MARRSAAWWTDARRGSRCARRICRPDVDRRRPGTSQFTTQRREPDTVRILSGVFEGRTTGTPIGLLVENEDQRSRDYEKIKDRFRPGHADYTYQQKYGFRDYRGGGRSSARETVMRVAAGAIARKFLRERLGVRIHGYLAQMGPLRARAARTRRAPIDNPFFCPDPARMQETRGPHLADCARRAIRSARASPWSPRACRPGSGEPVFERLDADLAGAMMGINAVKGVEIGAGFRCRGAARFRASRRAHAGGIQEQPRGRRARRHLLRPGHRGEHRAQAHLEHHAARRDHRRARPRRARSPPPAAMIRASAFARRRSPRR